MWEPLEEITIILFAVIFSFMVAAIVSAGF